MPNLLLFWYSLTVVVEFIDLTSNLPYALTCIGFHQEENRPLYRCVFMHVLPFC